MENNKNDKNNDVDEEHHKNSRYNIFKEFLEITTYIVTICVGVYTILKDFI